MKPRCMQLMVCCVLAFAAGCIFYEVPREVAVRSAVKPIDGFAAEEVAQFQDFPVLYRALEDGLEDVVEDSWDAESKGYVPVAQFLHITDAQVRDESIYENHWYIQELLEADKTTPASIRRPYVEAFDSLTLASFLIGYGKAHQDHYKNNRGSPRPFVVHTGDLLDISVTSELTETMQILRRVFQQYGVPIMSVGGNHDGLTFGNLEDKRSHTRGLGVNKAEFVLAHLLAYPDHDARLDFARGFGYANNEILARYYYGQQPIPTLPSSGVQGSKKEWFRLVARQLEDIQKAREAWETLSDPDCKDDPAVKEPPLSYPIFIKQNIETSGQADFDGVKLGYYSWQDTIDNAPVKGIRYIVLDTRSSISSDGHIDLVQLGWLYNELQAAFLAHQLVVIFAHHAPWDIKHPGMGALVWYFLGNVIYWPESDFTMPTSDNIGLFAKLLKSFPNIIAYFHGHTHQNREIDTHAYGTFPLIETGSTADFPQVGRNVEIYCRKGSNEVLLRWRFVRPKGDSTNPDGRLLQAYLNASHGDAKKEYNSLRPRQEAAGTWSKWKHEHLQPGCAVVQFSFDEKYLPNAEQLMGAKRLALINDLRTKLGLEPVGKPERP